MIIEYKTSVHAQAGFRSVYIKAIAEKLTDKRCKVIQVLTIDDDTPNYNMSRTGANRQRYNGLNVAGNEIGKTKIISKLFSVNENL